MRIAFVAAVLVLVASSADAQILTGQDIHTGIEAYDALGDGRDIGQSAWGQSQMVLGYIQAVYDMAEGSSFDAPIGVQYGTIIRVVYDHLDECPEKWAAPPYLLIVEALILAWGDEEQRARIGQ